MTKKRTQVKQCGHKLAALALWCRAKTESPSERDRFCNGSLSVAKDHWLQQRLGLSAPKLLVDHSLVLAWIPWKTKALLLLDPQNHRLSRPLECLAIPPSFDHLWDHSIILGPARPQVKSHLREIQPQAHHASRRGNQLLLFETVNKKKRPQIGVCQNAFFTLVNIQKPLRTTKEKL